jgi:hypothetical protein
MYVTFLFPEICAKRIELIDLKHYMHGYHQFSGQFYVLRVEQKYSLDCRKVPFQLLA